MLAVKAQSRQTIDSWTVAEAGLPIRVVNSVRTADIKTIGQLRGCSDSELLRLRSLGRVSLNHIHDFFELCKRIEDGRQVFTHIDEVLSIFLDEAEYKVLSGRYGFATTALKASRSCQTLQAIGTAENKTRERIRQIEETAMASLRSTLARVCLEPFYDRIATFLNEQGRSSACKDFSQLRGQEFLAGHNPCSIALLLHDLQPDRYTFTDGFFSTLSKEAIERTHADLLSELEQKNAPAPLAALCQAINPPAEAQDEHVQQRLCQIVLDHAQNVAATMDNRYFIYDRGMKAFLTEVMKRLGQPTHYRAITHSVNDHLKTQSRKGAGYILEVLNAHDACERVERGVYQLKS